MRNEEKPFVMYRSSNGRFRVTPRNAQGRRQTYAWEAILLGLVGLFVWFMSREPSGPELYLGFAGFLSATAACLIGMMRWMRARAEIIDLDKHKPNKR